MVPSVTDSPTAGILTGWRAMEVIPFGCGEVVVVVAVPNHQPPTTNHRGQ
jgi:hypothetical protein